MSQDHDPTDERRETVYPRAPAHLAPFIEILGPALTVRFLLSFGGATLYFPDDPRGRSEAEAMIGAERLRALSQRMASNRARIPTARRWAAHALRAEGRSISAIARKTGRSDVQVHNYLRATPDGSTARPEDL